MKNNNFKLKIKQLAHYLTAIATYWYYGRPSRKLIVIGVTGTKGKTTICRFIANVLEQTGHKVGMLTTVEFQIAEKRWLNDKKMTMLGLGQIHKMLRDMVSAGCRYAIVETSSEGIVQYRHYGLNYDIAVFTNLGTEHSERHGGFENLKNAKGKLFAGLQSYRKNFDGQPVQKISIINVEDKNAPYYLAFTADKKIQVHPSEAKVSQADAGGVNFAYSNFDYRLNIAGEFNVFNAVLAIEAGRFFGMMDEKIATGLASVKAIPGRMEFINEGQNFTVIVDFAHEPLSFAALFTSARNLAKGNKVISVIGSDGGGRDIGKRPKMGEVAGQLCDIVIVTDVNCYDEDPKVIAEMLAGGARQAGKIDNQNLFVEIDRKRAFALAYLLAKPGDVVLLVAKGTEPCMCMVNGHKIPWDDRQVARELLLKIKKQ